jgi:DNA-binding response OmpR family regulator
MAKKIAIIEDDGAIARMYELKLKNSGYQVKVAANGVEGLQLVESFRPDVMLLDLMMPEMNGDEMLAEVRKTDWGKAIRVIALTNISETEAPESLKTLNIDRYAVKAHHTPSEVLEIVDSVCKAA